MLVDQLDRIGLLDLLGRELEVLRPKANARRAGDIRIVGHDVHLRVVEERMRVQVRRADGQPSVVDDADLRVHVHRISEVPRSRVDRAGKKPRRLVRGVDERGDLTARDVRTVVRPCGEKDENAKVVARRVPELVRKHRHDLRRPEELILEVDEPLGRAQGADVRLEDRVVAAAHRAVCAGGERSHDLRVRIATAIGNSRTRKELASRSVPAQPEVLRDVRYRWAFDPHRCVVPADPAASDVVRCIPWIATVERQVDSPDERDLAVDHDRLLVVSSA